VDQAAFSELVASADAAMVVVAAAMAGGPEDGAEAAGCLVGFHCQSSIDPPRYSVWLSKANHTYRVALHADHLAVHFLAEGDLDLAEHFGTLSGDAADKFAGWEVETGPGGVPLLARCPHRLVIRRDTVVDSGGDHVSVTGDVVAAWAGGRVDGGRFTPLRYSAVADLDAGHPAEERPRPPTERAG
jgi:flavin reductase (DIM6/NTAB) family NADH-FMN oxidoreductase RutF